MSGSSKHEPEFIIQPTIHHGARETKPLLPPIRPDREYTLVLDLDETLVHFEDMEHGCAKVFVRPFVGPFLETLSAHYEIVIFTASVKEYADQLINLVDVGNWVAHRLYREHTNHFDEVFHKDLRRLGRDLSKTIIVDNNPLNFKLQPANGIYIKSWFGDQEDQALRRLLALLTHVAKQGSEDVRLLLEQVNASLADKTF